MPHDTDGSNVDTQQQQQQMNVDPLHHHHHTAADHQPTTLPILMQTPLQHPMQHPDLPPHADIFGESHEVGDEEEQEEDQQQQHQLSHSPDEDGQHQHEEHQHQQQQHHEMHQHGSHHDEEMVHHQHHGPPETPLLGASSASQFHAFHHDRMNEFPPPMHHGMLRTPLHHPYAHNDHGPPPMPIIPMHDEHSHHHMHDDSHHQLQLGTPLHHPRQILGHMHSNDSNKAALRESAQHHQHVLPSNDFSLSPSLTGFGSPQLGPASNDALNSLPPLPPSVSPTLGSHSPHSHPMNIEHITSFRSVVPSSPPLRALDGHLHGVIDNSSSEHHHQAIEHVHHRHVEELHRRGQEVDEDEEQQSDEDEQHRHMMEQAHMQHDQHQHHHQLDEEQQRHHDHQQQLEEEAAHQHQQHNKKKRKMSSGPSAFLTGTPSTKQQKTMTGRHPMDQHEQDHSHHYHTEHHQQQHHEHEQGDEEDEEEEEDHDDSRTHHHSVAPFDDDSTAASIAAAAAAAAHDKHLLHQQQQQHLAQQHLHAVQAAAVAQVAHDAQAVVAAQVAQVQLQHVHQQMQQAQAVQQLMLQQQFMSAAAAAQQMAQAQGGIVSGIPVGMVPNIPVGIPVPAIPAGLTPLEAQQYLEASAYEGFFRAIHEVATMGNANVQAQAAAAAAAQALAAVEKRKIEQEQAEAREREREREREQRALEREAREREALLIAQQKQMEREAQKERERQERRELQALAMAQKAENAAMMSMAQPLPPGLDQQALIKMMLEHGFSASTVVGLGKLALGEAMSDESLAQITAQIASSVSAANTNTTTNPPPDPTTILDDNGHNAAQAAAFAAEERENELEEQVRKSAAAATAAAGADGKPAVDVGTGELHMSAELLAAANTMVNDAGGLMSGMPPGVVNLIDDYDDSEYITFGSLLSEHRRMKRLHNTMPRKPRMIKCQHCENIFPNEAAMYAHMQTEHGKYQCPNCLKECTDHTDLIHHLVIHGKGRQHCCIYCGEGFTQSGHCKEHQRIHTGERPFKCMIDSCGRTFSRNSYLKQHERIHTGEKKFTCHNCGKTFRQSSTLKSHKRIHTGEKPYACGFAGCPKKFRHGNTRKAHMVSDHADLLHNMHPMMEQLVLTPDEGMSEAEAELEEDKMSLLQAAAAGQGPSLAEIEERVAATANVMMGGMTVEQQLTAMQQLASAGLLTPEQLIQQMQHPFILEHLQNLALQHVAQTAANAEMGMVEGSNEVMQLHDNSGYRPMDMTGMDMIDMTGGAEMIDLAYMAALAIHEQLPIVVVIDFNPNFIVYDPDSMEDGEIEPEQDFVQVNILPSPVPPPPSALVAPMMPMPMPMVPMMVDEFKPMMPMMVQPPISPSHLSHLSTALGATTITEAIPVEPAVVVKQEPSSPSLNATAAAAAVVADTNMVPAATAAAAAVPAAPMAFFGPGITMAAVPIPFTSTMSTFPNLAINPDTTMMDTSSSSSTSAAPVVIDITNEPDSVPSSPPKLESQAQIEMDAKANQRSNEQNTSELNEFAPPPPTTEQKTEASAAAAATVESDEPIILRHEQHPPTIAPSQPIVVAAAVAPTTEVVAAVVPAIPIPEALPAATVPQGVMAQMMQAAAASGAMGFPPAIVAMMMQSMFGGGGGNHSPEELQAMAILQPMMIGILTGQIPPGTIPELDAALQQHVGSMMLQQQMMNEAIQQAAMQAQLVQISQVLAAGGTIPGMPIPAVPALPVNVPAESLPVHAHVVPHVDHEHVDVPHTDSEPVHHHEPHHEDGEHVHHMDESIDHHDNGHHHHVHEEGDEHIHHDDQQHHHHHPDEDHHHHHDHHHDEGEFHHHDHDADHHVHHDDHHLHVHDHHHHDHDHDHHHDDHDHHMHGDEDDVDDRPEHSDNAQPPQPLRTSEDVMMNPILPDRDPLPHSTLRDPRDPLLHPPIESIQVDEDEKVAEPEAEGDISMTQVDENEEQQK